MRCPEHTSERVRATLTGVTVAFLLTAATAVAGPPEQARARPPYDAGVVRFEVVDESQPFDPLHEIMAHPRILVGVVYYPVRRGPWPRPAIDMSFYNDPPEYESYSRMLEWGWLLGLYGLDANTFLGFYGSSVQEHLDTERAGISEGGPIARGRFPVVVQFNGSTMRGHQSDDIGGQFARRGYIYVGLDAPGVSNLTSLGRVDVDSYPMLKDELLPLAPCVAIPGDIPASCYNAEPAEYGVSDGGPVTNVLARETYEVQRARDAVAMIEQVERLFPGRADTRRVGVLGVSLGADAAFVAPQMIDALRGVRGDRYAAYGVVPVPFLVNTIGLSDWTGHVFGTEIGAILCDGAPGCDPLAAARQFDFPLGFHVAEEDWLMIGTPEAPGAEWGEYYFFPGYGPGLSPPPSPENRAPANRILFDSISKGVPALWVQVPDSGHLNWNSQPAYRWYDDYQLPPLRLFAPGESYEPLSMELQQEILVHYAAAFFDLTLKGKRGSLGALRTGRYRHVTPDGRGVTVDAKSLERAMPWCGRR